MADNHLQIKISADAEQARRSVGDVAGSIEQLAQKLGGELGAQAQASADKLRALGQQEAAIKAFVDLRTQVGASERALGQLTAEADHYARQISQAGPPTANEAQQLARLRAAASGAADALQAQQQQLAVAAANMQRHGVATEGASRALARIQGDIQKTAGEVGQLDPRLGRVVQGWRGVGEAAQAGGQRASDAAERMGKGMSAAGQAAHRMAGQLAAAFTVREALQAAQDMEKLQSGLQAVTGDAALARAEMDFVRRTASQAGVDVVAAGNAYLGLAAATRGTAVEGQATRDVFVAVSAAMARAGKSSGETANALLALQQMAGKGVVSMEEMRQQLGEALPGAFQAAASGMGITTQELSRLIESGQVAAQDIFPALTKGLNELYGNAPAAQTLAQEITNIKNAFVDMAAYIGEAGGNEALKAWAERAQAAITLLGAGFVDTGKKIGAVIAALLSRDFAGLSQAFADIEAEGRDKLLKAAAHNDSLRAAIEAVGSQADKAALAQQQAAQATAGAGQAAASAAPSYAAMGAAYAQVREEMARQIELADKEVAAAKARGDAAVAEARLLGDEAALRQAVGQAAAGEAAALTDLAQKRQTEADVLRAELDNKKAVLAAHQDHSEQRKKEIAELQQLIQKKQVEADASRAQAAAARANAQAKGEEAQAAEAARNAAQAAATARTADAKASLSLLETQKALAGQSAEVARLMGDEDAARRLRIEQLQIDIQITRAKAQVQRAEAEGSIAVAQATMTELRVKGELTPVKQAELDASIKLAQAKLKEADAIAKSTRVTEQAIRNLRNFGDEAGRAGDKSKNATDKARDGWGDVAGAAREAAQAAQEYKEKLGEGVERVGSGYRNKDGMSSDASGKAIAVGRQTWLSIYQMVKGMGLSDEQARGIADKAYDSNGRYTGQLQREQMRSKYDGISVTEAARRAAEKIIRESGSAAVAGSNSNGTPGSVAKVVRVEFKGGNYDVDTSTGAGRAQLDRLLRDLGAAKGRAS